MKEQLDIREGLDLAPRDFGDLQIMAICFELMGSTGYYFQGSREQPLRSRDLGSPAESKKKIFTLKEKPIFR